MGPQAELADRIGRLAAKGRADFAGLARRGGLSMAGAGVSAIANFALIVVVTRSFDKETAGFLFSTTSLFVVVEAVCALGTTTGLVYFVARLRALDDYRSARRAIRVALSAATAVAIAVAACLALGGQKLAGLLDGPSATPDSTRFLILLIAVLPVAVMYDVGIAATQGYHTMNPTVVLEKVSRPLLQLAGLSLAAALGAAWLLPIAWAGPYLLVAAVGTLWLRRLVLADPVLATGRPELSLSEFWRYTAPRGLASVAQLSLQRLDIILVTVMLGPAQAALYTAATRFVVVGQLGSQAIALAVQPKLAELLALEDRATTKEVYRTTTAWVVAATWPIHLTVLVSAPIALSIFGPGYDESWPVTVILAAAMLFATACGMVTMLLVMAGKTSLNLINVVVALGTNLALNLILIPQIGINGAAIAWAAALVAANGLPLIQVRKLLGVNPFGRASLSIGSLSVLCFGVIPATTWVVGPSLLSLAVLIAVGGLCFTFGAWRMRGLLHLDELVSSLRRRRAKRATAGSERG